MMTDVQALAIGIAVLLVMVSGLYWKLTSVPARVWGVARAELAREHAANDLAVQAALGEAVKARAAALLSVVRQYHEQLAAELRRQAEDAQIKARVAERHATDTGTTVDAASELLREVRATLLDLQSMRAASAAVAPASDVAPEPEPDDSRKTIQAPARAPAAEPAPAVELPPAASAVQPPPAPAVELPRASVVQRPPAGAVQRPAGAVQRPPSAAVEPRAAVAQGRAAPRPPGNLKAALSPEASEPARARAQQVVLQRVAEERQREREASNPEGERPSELTQVVPRPGGRA